MCIVLYKGFEDINTNPNSVDTPNPDFVFSKSQLDGLNNNYFYTSILQCGQMMQHYASYKEASGLEINIWITKCIIRLIFHRLIQML